MHLTEGYVEYRGSGGTGEDDVVFFDETIDFQGLAFGAATQFTLTSEDDAAYITPTNPTAFSSKMKPFAFADYCEGFGYLPFFDTDGCINERDHVKEYFLFLTFDESLQNGDTYTLNLPLYFNSENANIDFTFADNAGFSPVVHVNNVGYVTDAPAKYAYLCTWQGAGGALDLENYVGNAFHLIDIDEEITQYTGEITFRAAPDAVETLQENPAETPVRNFNRSVVLECDFSDFFEPGTYRLCAEGIGCGYEFTIGCAALKPAYTTAMQGLYHNRSGIALTAEYTDTPRPAPHRPGVTPGFAGRLKYTATTVCEVSNADASVDDLALWNAGVQGDLEAWGWYQDAGDWDAYRRHSDVPAKLLFAYEYFPENFSDGGLSIPENANGQPDILDEARWLLRFYKRLKDETEAKEWTTGGVPGARIFGDLWGEDLPGGIGRGSWQDNDRTWMVSGEDALTTFFYAGAAAHYAWLLQREGLTDTEGIDWQTEAENAFAWANADYDAVFVCHAESIGELKNYAAAALFRLTGADVYETAYLSSFTETEPDFFGAMQGRQGYGSYIYVRTEGANAAAVATAENLIESTADLFLLNLTESRAMRWGGNPFFPMLVGQGTTPLVFEGIVGYAHLRDKEDAKAGDYLKYLHTTADYFLGTNPLNTTWMTGLGENQPREVFHLDSWYGSTGNYAAGIIPYGPWLNQDLFGVVGPFNNVWPYDKVSPAIDLWPGHERWFNQRYAPLAAEFTIDQNTVNAAVLYGTLSGAAGCTDVTSVDEIGDTGDSRVTVFPNPSAGVFRLHFAENLNVKELRMTDIAGRLVLQKTSDFNILSLAEMPVGVYFTELRGDDFRVVKKLLLQRR